MGAREEVEEEVVDRPLQRRLIVVVPALVLLGLIAYGSLTTAHQTSQNELPSFTLPLLDGGTLSNDDLQGQPVVLNFWASWCAPCREEAPLLEELWREYREQGVRFVGVNVQDNELGARDFQKEFGVTYPIALDPRDELAGPLGVLGLPQTFFIGPDGRFLEQQAGPQVGESRGTQVLGAISEETLRDGIEKLLEEST
ncbi:MAG: TlpA family protein disulfide reductase [Actinomycetota bacterium]|nr:TlpA family protein disulfide reductase [Actinomycetota bacterium]